jgi:hypothetical protein
MIRIDKLISWNGRNGARRIAVIGAIMVGLVTGTSACGSHGASSGHPPASASGSASGVQAESSPPGSTGLPAHLPALQVRSVDNMHLSRDTMCHQVSASRIEAVVAAEAQAHADTATIDMPYDAASGYFKCIPRDPGAYERRWIQAIRQAGMHVWFRQQWLTWQGNEGAPKLTPTTQPPIPIGDDPAAVLDGRDTSSYLAMTYRWVLGHREFFASGDIFTPESEPANAGILPDCKAPCMFADRATADRWLADSMTVDRAAFSAIGVDVRVGYWGLACTPDVASPATAQSMGVFVTDCYYREPAVLTAKLTALHAAYGVPIILGEWGDIWDGGHQPAMSAAIDDVCAALASLPFVVGLNYWQGYGESKTGEGIIDRTRLTLNPAGERLRYWFS